MFNDDFKSVEIDEKVQIDHLEKSHLPIEPMGPDRHIVCCPSITKYLIIIIMIGTLSYVFSTIINSRNP